jgi:hypothetical protein
LLELSDFDDSKLVRILDFGFEFFVLSASHLG